MAGIGLKPEDLIRHWVFNYILPLENGMQLSWFQWVIWPLQIFCLEVILGDFIVCLNSLGKTRVILHCSLDLDGKALKLSMNVCTLSYLILSALSCGRQ